MAEYPGCFGLVLGGGFIDRFQPSHGRTDALTTNLKVVDAEGTEVMQTHAALVTQVAYATSDQSVEHWAYQNKWVRNGEHLVQLESDGTATPTPVPQPAAQTEVLPNWQIWWELFFGVN